MRAHGGSLIVQRPLSRAPSHATTVWKTGTPAARAVSSRRAVFTVARSISSAPPNSNSGSVKAYWRSMRSEEHTSELQSRLHLVCRLLLEKKKQKLRKTDRAT